MVGVLVEGDAVMVTCVDALRFCGDVLADEGAAVAAELEQRLARLPDVQDANDVRVLGEGR